MTNRYNNNKFYSITLFMLKIFPGWKWKLPSFSLLGFFEIGILITIPLLGARIIDALKINNWQHFKLNVLILTVLTFFQIILSFFHRYFSLRLAESIGKILRDSIVNSLAHKNIVFFEKHWVGDIVSRTINDSSILKKYFTDILLQMLYDVVTIIVVIILLMQMNLVLAILIIITAPSTIFIGKWIKPYIETMTRNVRESIACLTGHLQSWFSNPLSIIVYSLRSQMLQQFALRNDTLRNNIIRYETFGALVGALNSGLLSIPSFIIFVYGGYLTFNGGLSIGKLFAFITYASYFTIPLQRLISNLVVHLPSLYPIFQRINEFTNQEHIQRNIAQTSISKVRSIRIKYMKFKFQENSQFQMVIKNFNIYKGEIIGITGPNGCGKSTFLKLLLNVYQPQSGDITFYDDDHEYIVPYANYEYSIFPQDQVLFDGTILQNITLFSIEPNKKKVVQILKKVDLWPWISSLPDKLNTEINAGLSRTLSGGQMQKIGLARLLYKNSPLLLLDEPSDGLDKMTSLLLSKILVELKKDHLIIIVTHKKNLLAICNRTYYGRSQNHESQSYCFTEYQQYLEVEGFLNH